MATKKTTTMIYKHLNFKNNSIGMSRLFKSLAHSLRISPTVENKILATKVLEWDNERSHLNLVYSPSLGKSPIALNTLTEKQKVEIQESFITNIVTEQKTKDEKSKTSDTLSKYKAKVNKWHNSITDDNDPLKILLSKFLDEKNLVDIESDINELSQFEFARKSQKTETVRKFFELHNKMIENKSDISRNKIFVQEAFFKIPTHNKVEVSTADLISNIHSFYKDNFPDYPIKLIVFHGDEVGNHPHIFVDAKNKRTGKYDLLTAQKKFVNANIEKLKDEYPNAIPLVFSNRAYSAKKTQAQYFQTLFYQHSNKMLEKYDVEAKKLEKTKENNARMRLIEEDAKKPKIERQFSFYNAETIRLSGNYERAQINASNALKEEEVIDKRLEQKKKDLAAATTQLLDAQSETAALNNILPALRSEKETLANDNDELQRKNNELLPNAIYYNEISDALAEIEHRYNNLSDSYNAIVDSAKKQIFEGIRNILSVMWGLQAWGKDKFTFGLFDKKMKGAPDDLNEFDNRTATLVKLSTNEILDAFIETDFLIPKEPITQAFKEGLK